MCHECHLVSDCRHPVVPQRHALLGIGNSKPLAGLPLTSAERLPKVPEFGFRMELPDGEFGLWREVATAVPSIDAEPSCPKYLRMGNEIAVIHVLVGGTKSWPVSIRGSIRAVHLLRLASQDHQSYLNTA